MTTTLTYDATLSRVHIAVTGLSVIADTATVERSSDMVTWNFVRGGSAVVPVGGTITLDDYEFSANVQNFYRVRAYDTAPSTYVTGGIGVAGNNTSLNPTLPPGIVAGDLVLIEASIRNSPTGAPVAPFGYTTVLDMANVKVFGRKITGGEATPTVTFTGGVTNATTLAQTAAFRNTSLTVGNVAMQLNAAQQNVPRAPISVPEDNMVVLYVPWKQSNWDSITPGPVPFAPIQVNGVSSTLGDDAAQAWSYLIQTTKYDLPASAASVGGGVVAISRFGSLAFYHDNLRTNNETASITPMIDQVWLKVIARPFLNRPIRCIATISPIVRRARNGIFPIVGRSFPIAVTDVRMSKELSIRIVSRTTEEREDLDLILATGDTYFFQSPPGDPMPTMYAAVGDTEELRPLRNRTCDNDWRVFTLPLTEIAAPTSDIIGSIGTWQTVVNTYATWSDVMSHHGDWASLLTLVGNPTDVIVP